MSILQTGPRRIYMKIVLETKYHMCTIGEFVGHTTHSMMVEPTIDNLTHESVSNMKNQTSKSHFNKIDNYC